MNAANHEQVSGIIAGAVKDFFSPIIRIYAIVRDITTSRQRQEAILSKLDCVENNQAQESELLRARQKNVENILKILESQTRTIEKLQLHFIGYEKVLNRGGLLSLALEDGKSPTALLNLPIMEKIRDLATRELQPDNELTHTAAEIGIGNIEYILSRVIKNETSTPYLFGVNKGGSFLANFLSHRLHLHEKYLVKCDYRWEFDKIYCEKREDIDGPIVIIDDIAKTGRTIRRIKEFLRETYPHCKIFSIVLIISNGDDEQREQIFEVVDYSPWFTRNRTISLPWSVQEDTPIEQRIVFNDKDMDQIVGRLESTTIYEQTKP